MSVTPTVEGKIGINKSSPVFLSFCFLLSSSSPPLSPSPPLLQMFTPKLVLLDFSDMASMPDVVLEVVECYGCVDLLVCNSSMKLKAPVQSVSLELDRNIMDVNYFGPSALTKGEVEQG